MVKVVALASPEAVWERLERADHVELQQLLLDALAGVGPKLLPEVRTRLRSASWTVSRGAISLVPRVGGGPRDLASVARHPQEMVRRELLRALRSLPPEEVTMDIVVDLLTDESQELRQAARSMLRPELLGARAIASLERLADDGEQPETLRRRCVEVLGRCPHDGAAEALLRLIQPRSLLELGGLRELAAVALRASPAPRAAACFQLGLGSSVRRVRKACERAAGGGT
jgi:HEAT repeat protein